MTRSAMHRGRLLAIAVGLVFGTLACSESGTSHLSAIDSAALAESLLYVTTHVRPKPQRGDERKAHKTHYDSLGGPYSIGVPDPSPRAQTREAPVVLTTAVNDSILALYLDSLSFDAARDNGELARVRCPAGSAAGCTAQLYIQPEIGMRKRKFSQVPDSGMVVARIINYSSTETDSTYHIPPLTRAYWYVYHTPLGLKSRVFMRTPDSTQKLKFLGPTKTYEECTHDPYGGPAIAKFRKCVDVETAMTRGDAVYGRGTNPFVHAVSFSPTPRAPAPLPTVGDVALTDTELWVKCAQGCCIAGP
jgi:hypothetical protein